MAEAGRSGAVKEDDDGVQAEAGDLPVYRSTGADGTRTVLVAHAIQCTVPGSRGPSGTRQRRAWDGRDVAHEVMAEAAA